MNISILNRRPRPDQEKPFGGAPPVTAGGGTGIAAQVKDRLWQRMARECEAMVRYALGTGLVIPVNVMDRLDQAISVADGPMAIATPDRPDPKPADAAARAVSAIGTSRFA